MSEYFGQIACSKSENDFFDVDCIRSLCKSSSCQMKTPSVENFEIPREKDGREEKMVQYNKLIVENYTHTQNWYDITN